MHFTSTNLSLIILSIICVFLSIFGSLYFYFYLIGEIQQAEIIYNNVYGENSNFNSIFWLCQKIFTFGH
tara:strand:- start:234 stop:440 length:207 start_codon:yes stop_codon:yes gene_type:complete